MPGLAAPAKVDMIGIQPVAPFLLVSPGTGEQGSWHSARGRAGPEVSVPFISISQSSLALYQVASIKEMHSC